MYSYNEMMSTYMKKDVEINTMEKKRKIKSLNIEQLEKKFPMYRVFGKILFDGKTYQKLKNRN